MIFIKKTKLLLYSFIIQSLGMIGNVIARIAFGNLLTETEFGVYNLIILMPNLIALLINLGVGHSISLDISKKSIIERNTIKFIYFYTLIVGSIFSVIGYIVFSLIYSDIPSVFLAVGSTLTLFYLINYFISYIFLGLQKTYTYFLGVNLIHLLSPLIFLLLIVFFEASLSLALLTYSLSLFSVCIFLNIKLYLLGRSNYEEKESLKKTSRRLIDDGKPFYMTSVLSFLNYRIDVLIIGLMLPYSALSSYTIAFLFIDSFGKVTQILSVLIFQKIPTIKEFKAKNRLTNKTIALTLILNVIAAILLIWLSDNIIDLIFPGKYAEAYEIILFLIPGMFFLSLFRILYHRIAADGYGKYGTFGTFISLCIMVILNIMLIPSLGIIGSAIGSSIAYLIMFIYIAINYRKVAKEI